LDYFELCLWLADQDFAEAAKTFGGSVRNAWQMLERPSLKPIEVRRAFSHWLDGLEPELHTRAVQPTVFPELMKALRARWPDRGPGSAKRPVHFGENELLAEMTLVLDGVVEEAA
jgi:hypothetical protein